MEFRFSDHVLDVARRELRRNGQAVALEPQVFDLLVPPCVREVAARIGSRPQGALEDEHGSVWTDV